MKLTIVLINNKLTFFISLKLKTIMKKVLILAYDFPPYVSVGGLRPYAWYKYFKEYDIEPIVVTRQWNNNYKNHLDYIAPSESKNIIIENTELGTIIKTPYIPNLANKLMLKYGENKFKIIRKIISAYFEIMQWFFNIGPKSNIYKASIKYLKNNKVDAIIATGDPFILFKYASKLSKKYNTPWIADYRDPWVQDISRRQMPLLNFLDSYFEKKYLKNVSTITTVSEFLSNVISQNIKNKKTLILPNGYDINNIETDFVKTDFLNFAFAGSIYNWHPIENILTTFEKFILENNVKNIQLNFYGVNNEEYLRKYITENKIKLINYIHFYPKLQNEKLHEKLIKSNVFLLFNDYSILGTKIFDYLGLKRKIILCFSNDKEADLLRQKYFKVIESVSENDHLQEDLLKETQSGIVAKDAKHFYTILEQLYAEFCKKGFIECSTINAEKYSRKYQVEKLAKIIYQCKTY